MQHSGSLKTGLVHYLIGGKLPNYLMFGFQMVSETRPKHLQTKWHPKCVNSSPGYKNGTFQMLSPIENRTKKYQIPVFSQLILVVQYLKPN